MSTTTTTTASPIAALAGITKVYGAGETQVTALEGADLSVYPGEILLIEGPSGSGKTTLISILGLLLRPTRGDVFIRGERVTDLPERALPAIRASAFGFVFQGFNLFPALTALENVAIAIRVKDPKVRRPQVEAARLLHAVGLADRMHHKPADLSGGQKQRVAIARALGGDPPLIIGDEPTAALDTKTALGVMALLRELATREGRAVVVVTHDPRLERFADRVAHVEDGRVTAVVTIDHSRAA
ncbi:MAG: ABC transporter ATP-binding protein [Myxococcales bacterium]|nr:ABC transporter ATP-binding protein [Myxococcales bacterium]